MTKVAGAAKGYGIEALSDLRIVVGSNVNLADQLQSFQQDVDHVTIQIRIHSVQQNREGSVGLDNTTKRKIHHFIDQIREAINEADLPVDKSEALFAKLNKFALEVDKVRTSLQSGMAIYVAICDGIGQGFVKLEPARRFIDSIAGLIGGFKAAEDHADRRLTPPTERRRLEPPPKRQLDPPTESFDDDIPF